MRLKYHELAAGLPPLKMTPRGFQSVPHLPFWLRHAHEPVGLVERGHVSPHVGMEDLLAQRVGPSKVLTGQEL